LGFKIYGDACEPLGEGGNGIVIKLISDTQWNQKEKRRCGGLKKRRGKEGRIINER